MLGRKGLGHQDLRLAACYALHVSKDAVNFVCLRRNRLTDVHAALVPVSASASRFKLRLTSSRLGDVCRPAQRGVR
jgi:hypothetical protein